jgi:hypothetical protein
MESHQNATAFLRMWADVGGWFRISQDKNKLKKLAKSQGLVITASSTWEW